MVKKLFWVVLLFVAFYAHARLSFSHGRVIPFIGNHDMRAGQGDETACDDYAEDAKVSITSQGPSGRVNIEGGKDEVCAYFLEVGEMFRKMRISSSTQYDGVEITPSGFPWMSARVRYVQRSTVTLPGVGPVQTEGTDELVLSRTLMGLKIKSIEARHKSSL